MDRVHLVPHRAQRHDLLSQFLPHGLSLALLALPVPQHLHQTNVSGVWAWCNTSATNIRKSVKGSRVVALLLTTRPCLRTGSCAWRLALSMLLHDAWHSTASTTEIATVQEAVWIGWCTFLSLEYSSQLWMTSRLPRRAILPAQTAASAWMLACAS